MLLLFFLRFRVFFFLDRGGECGDFFSLGVTDTRGGDFFGASPESFRLKLDTFYVILLLLLLLSRGNDQARDPWQNSAEEREQESASLNYEPLIGR